MSNLLKENSGLVSKALKAVALGQKWLDLHEEKMSLRGAELRGIFSVELYRNEGSFERKFIIPSALIPNSVMRCFLSTGAELRGIKPDFRIKAFQDLNAHYKACYLYAVTGNAVKSRYYADLMQTRYLREDGDFRTDEKNKGWSSLPCSPANRYVYPNGWIVSGLQRADNPLHF